MSADARGLPSVTQAGFGIVAGGVRLVVPAGFALEYVHDTPIVPVPLAPARLRGLAQLRGQTVTVFELGALPRSLAVMQRRDIVVLPIDDAVVGLLVDEAPSPVQVRLLPDTGAAAVPVLAAADPVACVDERGGNWCLADLRRLFESLAHGD